MKGGTHLTVAGDDPFRRLSQDDLLTPRESNAVIPDRHQRSLEIRVRLNWFSSGQQIDCCRRHEFTNPIA